MQIDAYTTAVGATPVGKLTAFNAKNELIDVEKWKAAKAGEKRALMIEALKFSEAARAAFIDLYKADVDGEAPNFALWEDPKFTAPTPVEPSGETQATEAASVEVIPPEKSTAVAATPAIEVVPSGESIVAGKAQMIASEVAGLSPQDSLANLSELQDRLEEYHFRAGAVLAHMQATEAYLTLGYTNMRELIAERTNFDYRKAMYLVGNYKKIEELEIPEAALSGVSWSALREVVPVLTAANYEHWFDQARKVKRVDLVNAVNAAKVAALTAPSAESGTDATPVAAPEAIASLKTKTYHLYADQEAIVAQAVEKAKVEVNADSTGAALTAIALAYTGQPAPQSLIDAAAPKTDDASLKALFQSIAKKEGAAGALRVLQAFEVSWPDVEVTADFDGASEPEPVDLVAEAAE